MLKTINLDTRAKDYAQNSMSQGNKYANSLVNISFGKITSFLPEKLNFSSIDFTQSIFLTYSIPVYDDTRENIYDTVISFLGKKSSRFALIETYYDLSDLQKMTSLPEVVFSENEIYFLLKSSSNVEEIKNAFSSARDYPFICGLIDLNDAELKFLESPNIQPNWWKIIAQRTQYVIVGAFDNEGFLVLENLPDP